MKIFLAVLAVLIAVALVLRRLGRTVAPNDTEEEHVSLVLLLADPIEPDVDEVREKVGHALDFRFPEEAGGEATEFVLPAPPMPGDHDEPDGGDAPEGHNGSFLVKVPQGLFLMHFFSGPYVDDPEDLAETLPDARLKKVLVNHNAWMSVDLLKDLAEPPNPDGVYRAMGKILAGFAGPGALGVASTQYQRLNEWSPETAEMLKGENPLEVFGGPTFSPVVNIDGNDREMRRAVARARKRFPEFVQAFRERTGPDQPFLIKAEFKEGDISEFMWVQVEAIEDGVIQGTLENEPNQIIGVKPGDRVSVPVEEINDWAFPVDGEMQGGFTMKILEASMNRR